MTASGPIERGFRDAVRGEATRLDADFADALAVTNEAGIPVQQLVERALARIRRRDAGRVGRLGERVARVRPRKRRVPSLSGSARFRVPDILTDTELIEVKNVARLALTPQLDDFARFAVASGLTFVLLTRFDTILSPELQELVDAGRIQHRHLGGLLSPTGRRLIRRLISDGVADTRDRS